MQWIIGCTNSFKFGKTIRPTYLPNNHEKYFQKKISIIDWLQNLSEEKDEIFIRSFLGKMLFTGDEVLKFINILSGGEKVRCMLSKMMMLQGNILRMVTHILSSFMSQQMRYMVILMMEGTSLK